MINTLQNIASDQIHDMADNYISQTNAFEAIKRMLGELNAKVDNNYNRLNSKIDCNYNRLNARMDRLEAKMDRLEYAIAACMILMFSFMIVILAKI